MQRNYRGHQVRRRLYLAISSAKMNQNRTTTIRRMLLEIRAMTALSDLAKNGRSAKVIRRVFQKYLLCQSVMKRTTCMKSL